jgi:hypothetical protein
MAIPVEYVSRAVTHALTAKCPRARYLVGKNLRVQLVIESLPHRLRDKIMLKALNSI